MPAVLLEALAVGVPVIATECSAAMRSLLDDGALGRLVPVGDLPALAAAMMEAPVPQDAPASLAQARRFTLEAAASAYLDSFDKISPAPTGAARAPHRHPIPSTMTSLS